MSWPMVALGEVAEIDRSGIDPGKIEKGTAYLGLEHIESGGRIIGSEAVSAGDLKSTKFAFSPDHVLFGKLRPYLCKIALPDEPGICSTDIVPIKPGPNLDRTFLAYCLRQPQMVAKAAERATGANLPRLSPKELERLEIPLPPLDEQKRIAAILDKADALRRARDMSLDRIDQIASRVAERVASSASTTVALGEIVDEFRYGTSEKATSSGTTVLRIPNVSGGRIDWSDLKTVELSDQELSRLTLEPGDLLFVRSNGNPEYVGRCAAFEPRRLEAGPVVFASYLIRARLAKSAAEPRYIASYMATDRGREALLKYARTSAGQFNINTKSLAALEIPMPSAAMQVHFVEQLDQIEAARTMCMTAGRLHSELFTSLQHRAFAGEL